MSISSLPHAVVGVAQSALTHLAALLEPVAGGLAGALAIIVFTLAVRALISPLSYLRVRGERRRAALAPELATLREKHRDDPLALATETLAVQRAAGVGPFAALLPGLAQAPFFLVMFHAVQPGPAAVAGTVFGVPLAAHLVAGWPVFAVLLTVAGLLAWWSSRRMRRDADPGLGAIARWLPLLPYATLAAVAWFPVAGALYLVSSTAWTTLEQAVWRRR